MWTLWFVGHRSQGHIGTDRHSSSIVWLLKGAAKTKKIHFKQLDHECPMRGRWAACTHTLILTPTHAALMCLVRCTYAHLFADLHPNSSHVCMHTHTHTHTHTDAATYLAAPSVVVVDSKRKHSHTQTHTRGYRYTGESLAGICILWRKWSRHRNEAAVDGKWWFT